MLLQHHHSRVCRKSHSQAQRVFKTAPLYAVTNPEPTASGPMPVAAIYDSKHYAIQSDHLNTPRRLVQSDSQVAWQWAYSAFGDEQPTIASNRFANADLNQSFGTTSVPAVTFNLRYPGQYFDQESNLHYNYHRSYHPGGGRYTQADPIGLDGGWNRFGYVGGNPLSFTDPSGLCVGPFLAYCAWLAVNAPWVVSGAGTATALSYGYVNGIAGPASSAVNAARNPRVYSVLFEAPISGLSRGAHRASANTCLANQLANDAEFAAGMNVELGLNTLRYMQSGRTLLNPLGTVWHHPTDNASVVQLLHKIDHTNSALQPILHPGGIGGYGNFYGK